MKAIVHTRYGTPETLQVAEVPRPEPGPDEVLIEVGAASINDWDWGLVRGKPAYMRLLTGLRRPKHPIPGVDVAGRVVAVGDQVQTWQPGDRVMCDLSESGFGAFAEFACAPQGAVTRIPASLSFAEAAALPHAGALTTQALLKLAKLRPTDRLLVNGAGGGVGTLAVQIARALGVKGIAGVDTAAKHERLRALGYQDLYDYRECDFTRLGQQYDVILDTKTDRPMRAYARALVPGGRYVTVGGRTAQLLGVGFFGRLAGKLRGREFRVLFLKPNEGLAVILELAEQGNLKPVLDQTFALQQTGRAIQRLGEGLHTGKIIVDVTKER